MSQHARSEVQSGDHRDVSGPVTTAHPANENQRGLHSGAFTKQGAARDWSALRTQPPPLPAAALKAPAAEANWEDTLEGPPTERAELHLAELRLEIDNPFFGSSLMPPAKRKRPWLKSLFGAVAGCALLAAGYATAIYQRPVARPVQMPVVVERAPAALTAPVPFAPAPAAEAVRAEVASPAAAAVASTPAPAKPAASRKAGAKAKPARAAARAAAKLRAAPPAPEQRAVARAEKLTREQVKAGLEGARGALTTCAAGGQGTTLATVTISSAGRITHAMIEGAFAGSPQGSCMARALRTAQFPATSGGPIRVRYPFVF